MNGNLSEEIKRMFKQGNTLVRLIYINVAVFLAVQIFSLVVFLFQIPLYESLSVEQLEGESNTIVLDEAFRPNGSQVRIWLDGYGSYGINGEYTVTVKDPYHLMTSTDIPTIEDGGSASVRVTSDEFVLSWLASTSSFQELITKPWSIVTYMFLHIGFMHILFNMIILFFAGTIFTQYLGDRRLLSIYILGGLAGFFLYFLAYNIFPVFVRFGGTDILGASAGVMAVFISIAVYRPNYQVFLMFIPIPIKLKWIAIAYVVLDLINIKGPNAGGHIAHLGGALLGFLVIDQYKRKGNDLSLDFHRFLDNLKNWVSFGSKGRMKVKHSSKRGSSSRARYMSDEEYNQAKRKEQEEIDRILDKISRSGYESLSKKEKETLFRASNNKNNK